MRLLSPASASTKTRHSAEGAPSYQIVGLALSPADSAPGLPTNCPNASEGCRAACVGNSGVGLAAVFSGIMEGRVRKTQYLRENRTAFLSQLIDEIETEQRLANRDGQQLACRLNTFSDIPWETGPYGSIPQRFPECRFYDYTKIRKRLGFVPSNYALCLSWSEDPRQQSACIEALHSGFNVAIAFAQPGGFAGNRALMQRLPKRFNLCGSWFDVFDGDETDLRFLDPGPTRSGKGRICGLRLKAGSTAGRNAAIESGFAVVVE